MTPSRTTMSPAEVLSFLSRHQDRHTSNKVLHGHPSPAFWRDAADATALRSSWAAQPRHPARVNLYFSIPFCLPTDPPHCGFCLFPTEDYRGKTAASHYLELMAREIELQRDVHRGSQLESFYVGGGTPNLLHPGDYGRLMELAEGLFPGQTQGIEKTLEGIPQLFSEDKIRAIQAAGFNRVSMGVQQLNERLIRYSGRRQTNRQVFDAIASFARHDLACNVDLIYAWPEQTVQDMLEGLRAVVASGIRHITHYELNIAGRSDFAQRQKQHVPRVAQKLEMYLQAKAYLESEGFVQRTVYDWERPEAAALPSGLKAAEYRYEQNLRDGLDATDPEARRYMCGFGHAAVNVRVHHSSVGDPSVSSMNWRSLTRYAESVQAGRMPVERFHVHTDEDVRLLWLFQSLQEMAVGLDKYHAHFGTEFADDFAGVVEVLEQRGWASVRQRTWQLSAEGSFYVPLIQSLMAQPRVLALQAASAQQAARPVRIPIRPVTETGACSPAP